MMIVMSLDTYSDDFFDFGGATYLNCAYHGALPRVAVAAAEHALRLKQTPNLLRDDYHFTFPDAFRAAAAELLGGRAENVAVTSSATDGIMVLVAGLDWRPGDEVVLPRGEFPANLFPWRSLEARGVVVRQVEIGRGAAAAERLAAALSPRTRVLSASWVSYRNGLRLDLAELGALCRDRGVLFCVDASQGLGGLAFDLAETPCDLLVSAGYKWLLGPYGQGLAHVAPELGERLAVGNVNWFSIVGARDFNRLSQCELEYEPGARRFDANETASFTNVAAATASLEYLNRVTPAVVERHARALLDRLLEGLPEGFRPVSEMDPRYRSNLLSIAAESDAATGRAFEALLAGRVSVSRREGAIRVSPHIYNTGDDIDRLLEVLRRCASGRSAAVAVVGPSLPVGEPVDDTPAAAPAREALTGRFVELLPLDPAADVAELYEASHGSAEKERLWTYLPRGPFRGRQEMLAWLEGLAAAEDPLFFTVVEKASGRRVGMVSYMRIVPRWRTLEVGHIWYTPSCQRTAVNTESVYLLLRRAFEELGNRRVEWKCDALNRRSRAAGLRLGFRFEGVFRRHVIVKGRNRDTAWFAMLDDDWPRIRANLERWLYDGEQPRPSLAAANAAGGDGFVARLFGGSVAT